MTEDLCCTDRGGDKDYARYRIRSLVTIPVSSWSNRYLYHVPMSASQRFVCSRASSEHHQPCDCDSSTYIIIYTYVQPMLINATLCLECGHPCMTSPDFQSLANFKLMHLYQGHAGPSNLTFEIPRHYTTLRQGWSQGGGEGWR